MPRKARIDASGALHHIIARGIDRNTIFQDNSDRNNFIDRLAVILNETKTVCYAWALIPNHFHLLLRTGELRGRSSHYKLLMDRISDIGNICQEKQG